MLPIGQLSEEAQEARNKDFRRYRQSHSRKMSRIHTNRDILSMLLISSDPVISSLRKSAPSKAAVLSPDAIKLLCDPNISAIPDDTEDSDF